MRKIWLLVLVLIAVPAAAKDTCCVKGDCWEVDDSVNCSVRFAEPLIVPPRVRSAYPQVREIQKAFVTANVGGADTAEAEIQRLESNGALLSFQCLGWALTNNAPEQAVLWAADTGRRMKELGMKSADLSEFEKFFDVVGVFIKPETLEAVRQSFKKGLEKGSE